MNRAKGWKSAIRHSLSIWIDRYDVADRISSFRELIGWRCIVLEARAKRFRELRELMHDRLRNLNLATMAKLSMSLTVQEFRSLEFLASAESRKTSELAEFLGLAMNSVTAVVDGLENKKLLRRQRDDSDRRIIRLTLTKSGQRAGDAIAQGHLDIDREFLGVLTVNEQERLLELYEKMVHAEHVSHQGKN